MITCISKGINIAFEYGNDTKIGREIITAEYHT